MHGLAGTRCFGGTARGACKGWGAHQNPHRADGAPGAAGLDERQHVGVYPSQAQGVQVVAVQRRGLQTQQPAVWRTGRQTDGWMDGRQKASQITSLQEADGVKRCGPHLK
jgi:hypothetical protein